MTDSNNWYIEHFERTGSAIGYRITGKLDEVQSPFQKIEIFQTTDWGNLMTIDGAIMLTSKDNFFYHEMISHPVLFTHAAPKRVVIIGGGDCGTLREVLKHKGVESVTQCDIDEQVTVMARKHFPELCDSNDDARAELLFDDGVAYMANCPAGSVDVVIVDSTDPVGPGEGLFNKAFYELLQGPEGRRHSGAAVRVAADAAGADQRNAHRDGQGRLRFVQDPAVPAAVLPHRLVERDHGAQGRQQLRLPPGRLGRQDLQHAVLHRRAAHRRAGDPAVRAGGTERLIKQKPALSPARVFALSRAMLGCCSDRLR